MQPNASVVNNLEFTGRRTFSRYAVLSSVLQTLPGSRARELHSALTCRQADSDHNEVANSVCHVIANVSASKDACEMQLRRPSEPSEVVQPKVNNISACSQAICPCSLAPVHNLSHYGQALLRHCGAPCQVSSLNLCNKAVHEGVRVIGRC